MVTDLSFSVIIPTFNREIFLLDAVRSAVNSRPKNTEIIVVNDGNELLESTKNILHSLNVTTLKTEGGVGASQARNYGAKHATGQWLLFLDDDDLIQTGYWKTLSEFLLHGNKTHHRSYGFCSMIAESDREEMHRIANKEVKDVDYIHKSKGLLRSKLGGLGQGFWLSRSIYEEVGGLDNQLKVNEDTDLCLKLIECDAECYVGRCNSAIIYKGPRNKIISKSVTKSYSAAERASYFQRIINNHKKILNTDEVASKWLWKRYLKMAARAKNSKALSALASHQVFTLRTKIILGTFWLGVFLFRL
jgi:glycosyltransferase involved in cell wall biosynthesis